MTENERQHILRMVGSGKISADEALTLMNALDLDEHEPVVAEDADTGQEHGNHIPLADPELEQHMNTARGLWKWATVLGVVMTILSAYGLYKAYIENGLGFWFVVALLPLMAGVAVLALAVGSRGKRWIYVDVEQAEKSGPRRIMLAMPASVVGAMLGFGVGIAGLPAHVTETLKQATQTDAQPNNPLLVKVDGDDGERVTIFIA